MVDTDPLLSEFSDRLDALAHPERLALLLALRDTPADEYVPGMGDGRDRPASDQAQRIQMDHVHLPKLDDHEVIDWDREADTVQKGPDFEEIEPILDVLALRRDDPLAEPSHR